MNLPVRKYRLKDIAEALDLSTATVSLCLNDGSNRYKVSPDTVKKVREFAAKVGYTPNHSARNLRNGSKRCVGLLSSLKWRAGQKFLPAIYAAEQQLSKHGIEVRLVSAGDQLTGLMQLRELGCDEVIIFSSVVEHTDFTTPSIDSAAMEMKLPGIRVYSVDYSMPVPDLKTADNMARFGVRIWDFQSRLIALMQKYYPGDIMMQSWRGTQCFLKKQYPALPDELRLKISEEDPFRIGAREALRYLEIRHRYNIRTVFWGDDRMSCGFINELLKHGVKIPEELNVISFDNLDFSQYLAIPLTTWGVPIVRHTEMALRAILEGKELETVVSKPIFSIGQTARLTPKMLSEIADFCDFSDKVTNE